MVTIFLVIYHAKSRLNTPVWGSLRSPNKLGYVKLGSTAFKVPKDGCGVPSTARALLGPEGLLILTLTNGCNPTTSFAQAFQHASSNDIHSRHDE